MATSESSAVDGASQNTDYHKETSAALDANVQFLTIFKDTVEGPSVKIVLESVISLLTFVKDEMIKEEPFVELANLCSSVCHMLKTVDNPSSFDKQVRELGRIVSDIESMARRRGGCPPDLQERLHISTEQYINPWREELCGILGAFGVLRCQLMAATPSVQANVMPTSVPSSGEHPWSTCKCDKQSDEVVPANHVLPQPGDTDTILKLPSTILDTHKQVLRRLVSGVVARDELPSLIKTIISNVKATDLAECFQGSGAQTFIDVVDEALDCLSYSSPMRRKCVKSLYKMCAHHALLPASLHFELPVDATGEVKYHSGYANVLKYKCDGREVAVKALQSHGHSSQEMEKRFCKEVITWKSLQHPNVLPLLGVVMSGNQLVMVSQWMTNGNIKEFINAHQKVNRFELLEDVAEGLIHMHSQGMVHGDLKGANILIDQTGRACLADFGLLAITSDATNVVSSNSFLQGGTCRWMSPELFDPEKFGLKDRRPTKNSDRYAFGMVIYEVLSGQVPFPRDHDYVVVVKVLKGERPRRPQGVEGRSFSEDIWKTLESCWVSCPRDRPRVEDVLCCLKRISSSWTLHRLPTAATPPNPTPADSSLSAEESTDDDDVSSASRASQSSCMPPPKVLNSEGADNHDLQVDAGNPKVLNFEGSAADFNKPLSTSGHLRGTPYRRWITRSFEEGSPRGQDPETDVGNPGRLELEESADTRLVPFVDGVSRGASLRRRTTCNHQESSRQSNLKLNETPLGGIEAWRLHIPLVPRGVFGKAFWEDVTGGRPDAVPPRGWTLNRGLCSLNLPFLPSPSTVPTFR